VQVSRDRVTVKPENLPETFFCPFGCFASKHRWQQGVLNALLCRPLRRKSRRFHFRDNEKMKDKRLQRLFLIVLSVLVGVFVSAACRSAAVEHAKLAETRQVTDDLGRKITVPVKITRVISLAPSLTENIFAVGAGDRLVGVTTFCNYPEQAKSIQKVGDTLTPNLETIVALKPDVVFVSTASQLESFKNVLEQNHIAVYVTNPNSLDGVLSDLRTLGDLFGTVDRTSELLNELQERTAGVSQGVEDEKAVPVFVQISREPLFTIGKESFVTALVAQAGGISVTSDVASGYPKLSKETALALNPEVIILSESDDNREPNEVFKNSPAVKNRKVFRINADLLSRPGPRLVDALEQIARDLHPDKF
jgi:iron complex transport system substrate-binding protein